MSNKTGAELPRHLIKVERIYVELGIWEENTLRKRDGKAIESCYFVEVSQRNLPGKSPLRPTRIGRAPNLVEARRLRDQLRVSLNEEIRGTAKVTLAAYYNDTWYPGIARRRGPAAAYDVACMFNGKILPVLGNRPLVEITRHELHDFIDKDLDYNAVTTKKKYRKVLGNLFKSALADGLISQNPTSQMEEFGGRKTGRARAYLTTAQLSTLLQYMRQNRHPYFLHVAVAALTGMRINEQAGLQWHDIVWDRDLIQVRRIFNRKEGFRDGTKYNRNSESIEQRNVPLNPELKSILKTEFDLRKPKGEEVVLPPLRKWVTGEQGEILHTMLTLLDLPRITWYQLRHSFAAALADLNVPLKTISEVLGHSKIETTAIYLVNLGATVRGAADKLRLFPDLNLTDEDEEEN